MALKRKASQSLLEGPAPTVAKEAINKCCQCGAQLARIEERVSCLQRQLQAVRDVQITAWTDMMRSLERHTHLLVCLNEEALGYDNLDPAVDKKGDSQTEIEVVDESQVPAT